MQQYPVPQTRLHCPMQDSQYSSTHYMTALEQLGETVIDDYPPTSGYDSTWPCYFAYAEPDYATWTAGNPNYGPGSAELPLYEPVPLKGPIYPSLLSDADDDASGTSYPLSRSGLESENADSMPRRPTHDESTLNVYLDAPQLEVNAREEAESAEKSPTTSSSSKLKPSSSSSSSKSSLKKGKREVREKPENLRKAYFRSVSETVGFTITDPDTIPAHSKKRSYLECLEEYVQWLHEQIRLAGHEPVPLERISSYRGLKTKSLRTMLVHMQNTIRNRNDQKLQAEQRFMELQNALLARSAADESLQFCQRSIASGATAPPNAAPNFVP